MLVKDCMTSAVEYISPDTSILEAAQRLRDGGFGMLPVAENDRLVGMITDRDITVRAVAEGLDPRTAQVRDAMSRKVLYCYDDQYTRDVARNMGANQVRRMPVLNREKRLVGIVSLGDIALFPSAEADTTEEALREISRDRGDGEDNLMSA